MDEAIGKILEIVTETQEDVSGLKKDVLDMRRDLADMRRDIDMNTRAIAEMSEQLRNVFGYAKEIDLLMARVSVLEKHAGLAK